MSTYRTDYVIYGYDLSKYKSEFDCLMEEASEFVPESVYTSEDEWCVFSDYMDDDYFYLGYCIAEGDIAEGFNHPVKIDIDEIERLAFPVEFSTAFMNILDEMTLKHPEMMDIKPELIVFSDWR